MKLASLLLTLGLALTFGHLFEDETHFDVLLRRYQWEMSRANSCFDGSPYCCRGKCGLNRGQCWTSDDCQEYLVCKIGHCKVWTTNGGRRGWMSKGLTDEPRSDAGCCAFGPELEDALQRMRGNYLKTRFVTDDDDQENGVKRRFKRTHFPRPHPRG